MTCASLPWIDYLEERLSPADREAVAVHLEACPACARELGRWRALLHAAAGTPAGVRLGCPSPEDLAALGTPAARDEVARHAAACPQCAEEARAVAAAEIGVAADPVPLPPALGHALGVDAEAGALSRLAGEVLALVRDRLGAAHPALAQWRRGVAALAAGASAGGAPGAAYAAPDGRATAAAAEPLELRLQSGALDLTVSCRNASIRVAVRRGEEAVSGVRVEVENALGEVKATTTDRRGEAVIRDDVPGRRRVGVREG